MLFVRFAEGQSMDDVKCGGFCKCGLSKLAHRLMLQSREVDRQCGAGAASRAAVCEAFEGEEWQQLFGDVQIVACLSMVGQRLGRRRKTLKQTHASHI